MASRMSGEKHAVVVVVALLSIATLVSVAEAAIRDGAACTATGKVVGVQTKSGRTSFICKAEGKKKVWRVLKSQSSGSSSGGTSGSSSTTTAKTSPTPTGPPYQWWGTWEDGWKKVASAPPCPADLSTLFTRLPFDVDDVTSIVRPGYLNPQSGYKAHSHIRYSPSDADGRQVIYAPADGWLFSASRYREAYTPGNDQVILSFFTECGVMWTFDHLRDGQLSASMAAAVAKVPVLDGDTRGTTLAPVRVKAGEVLATAVGATNCEVGRPLCLPPGGPNYFADFGVYDPRQLNEAARSDPSFLVDPRAGSYKGIGLCWINLFTAAKAAMETKAEGRSDYC
jgi:hypothetical protein